MKKLTFTLLLALMAIFSAQAAKVYLKIGEGRVTAESNLAVWVWEGKNNFCTNKEWPGDKLTEKETIEGADYFVYTVNTEGSYNLIFNNNEKENANTNRTADILAYIIHSGFISGYQNRYGDNLKPPTNVYHRMTA